VDAGSGNVEDRLQPFEAEVQATERLLGVAYAENADLRRQVEELQAAVDRRDLVERAKGVIMGRLDIDADHAWDLLHAGANGDLNGAQIAAAAVVAFRRTPAEIAATVLRDEHG
jgi:AmiR/NasT family two-component response regulator